MIPVKLCRDLLAAGYDVTVQSTVQYSTVLDMMLQCRVQYSAVQCWI